MAEHGWTVLCGRFIVDAQTKQSTLVDTADLLWIHKPEKELRKSLRDAKKQNKKGLLLPSKLYLVTWWFRSEPAIAEEQPARAVLTNPSGERVEVWPYVVDLEDNTFRGVLPIESFPVTELGRHFLSIEKGGAGKEWQTVARLPLDVRARETPMPSTEPQRPSERTPSPPQRSSSRPATSRPSARPTASKRQRRRS